MARVKKTKQLVDQKVVSCWIFFVTELLTSVGVYINMNIF